MKELPKITRILFKYLTGNTLTAKQRRKLDKWLEESDENRALLEDFNNVSWFAREWEQYNKIDQAANWAKIVAGLPGVPAQPIASVHSHQMFSPGKAAFILLVAGVATVAAILLVQRSPLPQLAAENQKPFYPAPALDNAILQLADETATSVADLMPGCLIAQQDHMIIYKEDDGGVRFEKDKDATAITDIHLQKNVLVTPPGSRGKVTLADGSIVLLDAGSSLSFPTTAVNGQREVELNGGAFFEIAHDSTPFLVHTNKATMISIGTKFSIVAYPEDSIVRATLVEGTLLVKKDLTLQPMHAGQLASIGRNGIIRIQPAPRFVDPQWFSFVDEPIDPIVTQLSRWYGAKFVYREKPTETFTLKGSRTESLDELLTRLQKMGGIHFKIRPDTIFVTR